MPDDAQWSEFELPVLAKLLEGSDPLLATLREQLRLASPGGHDRSGKGFFRNFNLPEDVPLLPKSEQSVVVDGVFIETPEHEPGALALLFVRDGKLDFLEVAAVGNEWPDMITEFELRFVLGREEDVNRFRMEARSS